MLSSGFPIDRKIKADDIFTALDPIPEMHRNIFRGKNLGTVYTDEQKAAIRDGTFHDLWVGDYWTFDSGKRIQRIVDINYWYGVGQGNKKINHVVAMTDSVLYRYKMNDTATASSGYAGSDMRTNGLTQAKEIIDADFGSNFILSQRIMISTLVTDGKIALVDWYDSTVELPNEIMMYGCFINAAEGIRHTLEKTQLALMKIAPYYICPNGANFWLRDACSDTEFARVFATGAASSIAANTADPGVRPVFGITGGEAA